MGAVHITDMVEKVNGGKRGTAPQLFIVRLNCRFIGSYSLFKTITAGERERNKVTRQLELIIVNRYCCSPRDVLVKSQIRRHQIGDLR